MERLFFETISLGMNELGRKLKKQALLRDFLLRPPPLGSSPWLMLLNSILHPRSRIAKQLEHWHGRFYLNWNLDLGLNSRSTSRRIDLLKVTLAVLLAFKDFGSVRLRGAKHVFVAGPDYHPVVLGNMSVP